MRFLNWEYFGFNMIWSSIIYNILAFISKRKINQGVTISNLRSLVRPFDSNWSKALNLHHSGSVSVGSLSGLFQVSLKLSLSSLPLLCRTDGAWNTSSCYFPSILIRNNICSDPVVRRDMPTEICDNCGRHGYTAHRLAKWRHGQQLDHSSQGWWRGVY